VDERIERALLSDRTVDITTTGRQSGALRRIETWLYRADGKLYLSGSPGRRDWFANIAAHPHFTLHLKRSAVADLPARGRPVTEPDERRRVLAEIVRGLGGSRNLDAWIARSPLVEVQLVL
jgi:deazaflavin-dependent oxidoreductase (nitroreductase family)